MRLLRKRSTYFLFLMLLILSLTSDASWHESVTGNPGPWDENWAASPLAFRYNGSILFEHEYINVTFDETRAIIVANYSFNNPCETASNLTLVIPFLNAYNASQKPDFSKILLDETIISFEWRAWDNIALFYPYYPLDYHTSYYLIDVNLTLDPFEKKVLSLHYSREYAIYDYYDNPAIMCEYKYFVGSLQRWNHPIKSAEFEFRVPKTICDDTPEFLQRENLGDNISVFTEYDTFYQVYLKFENWTLPPSYVDNGNYDYEWFRYILSDFIVLRWAKRRPWDPFVGFENAQILVISLLCLIVITVRRKQQ